MPIPTFDQMLRPILALAAETPIKRREPGKAMIRHFSLTAEEQQTRIPSGGLKAQGRAGWAVTFLSKAGLIAKVAPHTYGATDLGRQFLVEHPHAITVADLRKMQGWKAA